MGFRTRCVGAADSRLIIGFLRKPADTAEGSTEGQSWVPVLDDVRSLQIRYFDPRLNAWVDKWTDNTLLPRLIRLVVGRPDRTEPLEAIIALGRTPLPIMPITPLTNANANPGGNPAGNPGGAPGSTPGGNPGKITSPPSGGKP